MAAGDPLGIGITALTSFQRALGVTSNNVANVNTEGYNRQTIELSTRVPQFTGSGFIGSGVAITDIRRAYSDVLTEELRNATSLSGQAATYYKFAKEIDDLVANPDAGISPVLQNFFNAVNDVANEPTSIPARQVLLSQAQELTDRFVRFQGRFTTINHSVNQELEASVNDINSLTRAVARLNESIVVATGAGNGNIPNDLLDQRDQLLKKISEHVAISVVDESDGSTNVFMGKGQLIVNRFKNQELTLVNNEYDPEQSEVAFTQNGVTSEISNQISGGRLGGALTFRDEVLKTSEGALGRVAYALAVGFNGQHNLGMHCLGLCK
ncbi:MAG: flagellar hook-associated protein 1 FlgK [Halothiobacillaceae bacterium]|nr:MAG: flagellar hook-associated protein 1 FlgK [Halothiobacillaceae bacterium]